MRSISSLLLEALDTTTLKDLNVIYIFEKDVYVQVPESMEESDIQTYLDDTLLPKLPPEIEGSEKSLGKNVDNLVDVYFEYDRMETTSGSHQSATVEWDAHYDEEKNGGAMQVMRIKGMKYVISFDKFELKDVDESKVKETLDNLFDGLMVDNELPEQLSDIIKLDTIDYTM